MTRGVPPKPSPSSGQYSHGPMRGIGETPAPLAARLDLIDSKSLDLEPPR